MTCAKTFGRRQKGACWVVMAGIVLAVCPHARARPSIIHEPVKNAIRGQPITIAARVTDPSGKIKSVTLYYSTSKDAAPFRIEMQDAVGIGNYVGTIPAQHVDKAETIYYYVEATDPMDNMQETPWYTISMRSVNEVARLGIQGGVQSENETVGSPGKAEEPDVRWGTVGLIAGGAAAIVGGAFLISSGGGGDGDSSEGIQPGDYDGTVTECFTPDGGAPACSSHSMTIRIGMDGRVSSDSLRESSPLEGLLRGNKFTLTAGLDNPTNGVGQVVYSGTIANNTIVGTISGEALKPTGSGQFSGTFSATLRP